MKSRIPEIERKLPAVIDKALKDGAERIATQAAASAPVRTGELKASIEAKPGVFRVRERPAPGYGVYAAWYYHFVEFGTQSHGEDGGPLPAQPFLTPAAEAERPRLLAEVKRALGDL